MTLGELGCWAEFLVMRGTVALVGLFALLVVYVVVKDAFTNLKGM